MIKKYYEDVNVLHVGTMPNRAYYIPYASQQEVLASESRAESSCYQLLNGSWKFKYFESVYDFDEALALNTDIPSDFDEITVPSVWQIHGYDSHQYINMRYPFPFDPPYVPQNNPCGVYKREFIIEEQNSQKRKYLNFEGVDSCLYVYINGCFVGYSQVSHCTSEFDITDFVHTGSNTIAVVVLKWCDGSYLEDQDKFRMSGIFRDVYILHRAKEHIYDFDIKTVINDKMDKAELTAKIKYNTNCDAEVKYSLFDTDGSLIEMGTATDSIKITVKNPKLWNSETPNLYLLLLENVGEFIKISVGFRKIEVKNGVLLLNGQKIKFHGVNRHDSNFYNGFVVTREDMLNDLRIMKEHNVNAIRKSHYPNCPEFMEYCDKYGFYVIDEADIECHGVCEIFGKDSDFARLANDPLWNNAFLDRVKLLYERDKNHPCVLMWSMGNESGYGQNIATCLAYIKERDGERLTHYQSLYAKGTTVEDVENLDTFSLMYPTFERINEFFEKQYALPESDRKPFVLCEYCHAMGNGPGDLEDYWQEMESHEDFCGGFVWEWCDHAVYGGKTEDGKIKYLYGGDFGEAYHDSNYCVDGLIYPDRRVSPSLLEYKNVIRPIRISYDGDGYFTAHNYLDYTNVADCIKITYELNVGGNIIKTGAVCEKGILNIEPHGEKKFELDLQLPPKGSCYIRFIYTATRDVPFINKGHIYGFDQIELRPFESENPKLSDKEITYTENDRAVIIKGNNFEYAISKLTGLFEKLDVNCNSMLKKPMELNVWRAPTDNDMHSKSGWIRAGFDQTYTRAYSVTPSIVDGILHIGCVMALLAEHQQRILNIFCDWQIDGDGKILCNMDVKKSHEFYSLPRFGVRLFLDERLLGVDYAGYGPVESYFDKRNASYFGKFSSTVEEQHEDYIRPQENGSHYGCERVEVSGESYGIEVIATTKPFCFNASYYTQEMLTHKCHSYELEKSGYTVLCVDYAQTGIGSHSCGPSLQLKNVFKQKEFTFTFCITPTN